MAIRDEVLKELLEGYKKPEDLLGPEGLLKQLTAALVSKALSAEMTEHLGYEKHEPAGRGSGNSRNGTSDKTLKTESGEMPIDVPRDRNGTFEPQLVKKHQTHFDGFDEKIISMYARGMTVREIQGHLQELYGVDVSPDLISRVTAGSDCPKSLRTPSIFSRPDSTPHVAWEANPSPSTFLLCLPRSPVSGFRPDSQPV